MLDQLHAHAASTGGILVAAIEATTACKNFGEFNQVWIEARRARRARH